MRRQALYFVAPATVEVRDAPLPLGQPGQVLVETLYSAISAGTELLVYRGQAPATMPADVSLPALTGSLAFPLKYGYACVGRVVDAARTADTGLVGETVFAFHPHESLFWANPAELHRLPGGVSSDAALFLPNVETAVNLLHDGRPLVGEQVLVFGQGIVGLLTAALLAQIPLERLITADRYPRRRQVSLDLGAHASFDPSDPATLDELRRLFQPNGADLAYELSGQPEALNQAISLTGFGGRIVIGSWYGVKRAHLDLGGAFHRSRIQLLSSQVSTIAPGLTGRWDKARRLAFAWRMVAALRPDRLITHRFPLSQAAAAYRLLDQQPGEALQVMLEYG